MIFPFEIMLVWLFVVGTCIGSFLNVCIYRLPIGETVVFGGSHCRKCNVSLRWYDNIPIFGWLRLRGRCRGCGEKFSVRYLLVELFTGIAFSALYWWEIGQNGLYPPGMLPPAPGGPPLWLVQHGQYASHVVLLCFMIVASVIDLDSYQIHDEVTVTGTLLGLIGAAAFPWSMLPNWSRLNNLNAPVYDSFLPLSNLQVLYPRWLENWPEDGGLYTALACYLFWWVGVTPWPVGNSLARKWRVVWTWHFRKHRALLHTLIGVVGSLAIVLAWSYLPMPQWKGLMTSLAGAAWGLGLVWLFRVVASKCLGKEALGFGDAMLMAMVGAFLGWQSVLLAFFLFAPIMGLVVAMIKWLSAGGEHIPYGPYLCLGTAAVVVAWQPIWDYCFMTFFLLGWMLPALILASTGLMAIMLLTWVFVKYMARKQHAA